MEKRVIASRVENRLKSIFTQAVLDINCSRAVGSICSLTFRSSAASILFIFDDESPSPRQISIASNAESFAKALPSRNAVALPSMSMHYHQLIALDPIALT